MLLSAVNFACEKHKYQKRKNNDTPYINHPIRVAHILQGAGIDDENILIGAILHDTIEDTNTTYDEIKNNFNEKIANIVQEVSDDKSLAKVIRKKLQIEHSKNISMESKLVKLADKIDNLSDLLLLPPKNWCNKRVTGYFVWSKFVVDNLMNINEDLDAQIKDILNKKLGNKSSNELSHMLCDYYNLFI